MTTRVEKISLSLPSDAVKFADELAKEWKMSRSKVVSSCLLDMATKRLHEQMAEGYKAMAKENRKFANEAINLAHEVLPEWE
jgi:metal-responsive CopG/Arc/MetJ family transcriptional regulator